MLLVKDDRKSSQLNTTNHQGIVLPNINNLHEEPLEQNNPRTVRGKKRDAEATKFLKKTCVYSDSHLNRKLNKREYISKIG